MVCSSEQFDPRIHKIPFSETAFKMIKSSRFDTDHRLYCFIVMSVSYTSVNFKYNYYLMNEKNTLFFGITTDKLNSSNNMEILDIHSFIEPLGLSIGRTREG